MKVHARRLGAREGVIAAASAAAILFGSKVRAQYVTPHEACCKAGGKPVGSPDMNQDAAVGVDDLVALLEAWGPCPPSCCPGDLDADDEVGPADLAVLLSWWNRYSPRAYSWCAQ